ncbi:plasminogen-like [Mytilus edulis]|uniref:plasminogen-like n=1 Tax=Mytilus edulis TaxID=6550 RepID=UPI0039EFEFDB
MKLTDTFVLSGDVCGGDERLPVVPTGTTSNFHFGTFIGMVFTCDTLSSGTSVDHCPVSQCGTDDQWTTGYSVSCTDEDCYTDSTTYQGKVTCTVTGITCDVWTSVNEAIPAGPDKYTNYCRDPDNTGAPWCYTTDPEVRWEYCPVPKCDVCGGDERLPVVPTGTTSNFHFGIFIGMVFTCDTLSSGTSVDHCPVSQCGTDDQWTTGYSVSCTDEDCYTDSTTYQGKVTCTVTGITCDVWTTFGAMPAGHPDKDTNYCRDPDNTGAPWCYTTDPDERWNYCPVPKCA